MTAILWNYYRQKGNCYDDFGQLGCEDDPGGGGEPSMSDGSSWGVGQCFDVYLNGTWIGECCVESDGICWF